LLPLTLAAVLFILRWSCSRGILHPPPVLFAQYCSSPSVLCPVRSPCRMTPRLLPFVFGSRPSSRRQRTLRRRPPLPVAAFRPPTSSSRSRSPRPPPWRRRLQLPVSACHLRLHHCLPRSWPHSSSPPPLQPTKTRSSPDFTFRRP
jgi:hypothetical protein